MHTAIGLSEADDDEAMASFSPYTKTNLAFVGWAFFALINIDLIEDTIANLRAVVTPESVPQWGDFRDARAVLARHSLASKVHFLDENTACMKYLPEVDRTRQVTSGCFPIVEPMYMTLQRRPDLDGEWRVFSAGGRVHHPEEISQPGWNPQGH